MSDCITTYTGRHIDPVNPDPDMICIEDIAHALSLICRGNGHVQTFFSVGQHCINCAREALARGCSDRMALACLLHDASECYLSDVPRPFKKTLAGYKRQEESLLNLIYEKYLGNLLTQEEKKQLKEIPWICCLRASARIASGSEISTKALSSAASNPGQSPGVLAAMV